MSNKHKKHCRVLNCINHLLIVISTITGYVSISAFASLVCLPIAIASSGIGLNICAITAGNKKYKSIIKKKKERHDKTELLPKSKLSRIEVLISEAPIDSKFSHDEFVLINNMLKKIYINKEEIKNSNNK